MTGSRFTDGCIAAENMVSNVWSCVSPTATMIPAMASVSATTASWSQKPARVSVILRSSTSVSRQSGGCASRPSRDSAESAAVVIGRPPRGRRAARRALPR